MGLNHKEFFAELFFLAVNPRFQTIDNLGDPPRHYLPFVAAMREAINYGNTVADVHRILIEELTPTP